MKHLKSEIQLGEIVPNITTLLVNNASKFKNKVVFQQISKDNQYKGILWEDFLNDIENIAYNLYQSGFSENEKLIIFSPNCLKMLELELAVMSMGAIAVPIFSNFKKETAELLIAHSDANFLAVAGSQQLNEISEELSLETIWSFESIESANFKNLKSFDSLLTNRPPENTFLKIDLDPNTICLNMYTSGTMGTPKCVQLTHRNILSQQAALASLDWWNLDENDRFLSYLPWHHSFGGIFELFSALYVGATYCLESGYGRDVNLIFKNWNIVQPTVFFSVPKVYKALIELTKSSTIAASTFFDSGLKFVFTAAASLPEMLSQEFEKRAIPVIEGWGLTETSPCCTLTDPRLKREAGVVGMPIPGIEIKIAKDDEILVRGPNVMVGYYKNDPANKNTFSRDGWYRTGDVGTITDSGVKLISRKDRIFKLSNGEKVIPTDLEREIEKQCHYVQYAIIAGKGEEHPVTLIFPNKKMMDNPDFETAQSDYCFCPRNLNELGKCLHGCLHIANENIGQKFAKVRAAAVILDDLSLEAKTLTPSMKMAPNNVLEKYRSHLLNLFGDHVPTEEEVYVIELESKNLKQMES